jgi:hypothetical protein
MYDPTQGRFIQRDPLGYAAGDPNLYGYVGQSPATATDPTGLAGPLKVLADWQKKTASAEFTVRMGECCYQVRLFKQDQERVVERDGVAWSQWRNLTYPWFKLGEKVACTGREVGELLGKDTWKVFRPPWRAEGEERFRPPPEPPAAAPLFGEAAPTGTELPGGAYAPHLLGD